MKIYIDAFSHLYDKWKRLFDGFSEKEHFIIHPLHNFIQFDVWNSKSSESHFLWRFRRFWLFIDRIYIILFFPQDLREDCHTSSRVSAAVISSWSRRRPHRFHLSSGTQKGKGERSNHSIKREQKELAHSAERENGRMKSNLCGGPAPPHSPRTGNTADRFGYRHRAHPHTTVRAWMLSRHSIGFRAVSHMATANCWVPVPWVFFYQCHGIHGMFTPLTRTCRKCRGAILPKAVWLSLWTVTATPLFSGRWRVERLVMIGDFNPFNQNSPHIFHSCCHALAVWALDLHTAKVSHARLAASVFMQHLWKSSSQSKLFERISPTPARNLPIAGCRAWPFGAVWKSVPWRLEQAPEQKGKKITSESRESLLAMPSAVFLRWNIKKNTTRHSKVTWDQPPHTKHFQICNSFGDSLHVVDIQWKTPPCYD